MDIRPGLRMRHKRLNQVVTIVHARDTRNPCTGEVFYQCLVRTDDGRDYYASHSDLEPAIEQTAFEETQDDPA